MDISQEIKKIADHYGYPEQSYQLTEECAELIQALSKFRRAVNTLNKEEADAALDNIVEEIADVEIMLEQVKWLLRIPEEDMQAMKVFKIIRTKERIMRGE